MHWDRRQARLTLLLFLLIFTLGQLKAYIIRPVYPDPELLEEMWPPEGLLVNATILKGRALEVFSTGTAVAEAMNELGLKMDPLGSGFCLPRAGVLYMGPAGWRVRPMTQRERWVWRIPMDLNRCNLDDLQRIKGIGPSLAEKIYRFVQNRGHLNSITDLDEVPGIGERKLEVLKKELEVP
jgi:competence ComEA-like helix-hairpin-helix protein